MINNAFAIALALPIVAAATHLSHSLHKRLHTHSRVRCITHIVRMLMSEEEPNDRDIRSLRLRYTPNTILASARFVAENLYGERLHRLDLIMEECRERRWRNGDIAEQIDLHSRFALRHIARLTTPLSWHKVAQLVRLMRRSGEPIEYAPLLTSHNRNLELIGIYLCALFTDEEGEEALQRLAISDDEEVAYAAMLTLCTIRGDISTQSARLALSRLVPHLRASFIRHAALCCYSPRTCNPLLNGEEQRRFSQHVNSYKHQIVCN